jgi:hypothetical protein
MKLLLSVFLTPDYITRYRTPAISKNSQSKYDRIDKFLTMLDSITEITWESVDIYMSIDPAWKKLKPSIQNHINSVFPNRTLGERLSHVSQWRNATSGFSAADIVLLQANDDHALLPESKDYLYEIERIMSTETSIRMSAITHYPEFRGLLHRQKKLGVSGKPDTILVNNAIGTTMVKADFLRSWFSLENFPDDIKMVRPDNPFGESVRFPNTKMFIPTREVMRHLDGYSHALLYRPLSPLRSTRLFSESKNEIIHLSPWKIGLWPSTQYGYRGKGVDLYHQIHSANNSLMKSIRIDIGNQIAANSLSINFPRSLGSLNPKYSRITYKFFICLISVLNINVFRNLPDFIMQFTSPKSIENLINGEFTLNKRKLLVSHLGFFRGNLIFLKQKYWWLMPANSAITYGILVRKIKKFLGE